MLGVIEAFVDPTGRPPLFNSPSAATTWVEDSTAVAAGCCCCSVLFLLNETTRRARSPSTSSESLLLLPLVGGEVRTFSFLAWARTAAANLSGP